MDTKITAEMAQAMAEAHADGVSYRALGKLYGVSPSIAHRHATRANAAAPPDEPVTVSERREPDPEPTDVPGVNDPPFPPVPSPRRKAHVLEPGPAAPGADIEVAPDTGATKRHPESAFPEYVQPNVQMQPGNMVVLDEPVVRERPPDRAPGQHKSTNTHPLEWAEHQLKCTAQDIGQLRRNLNETGEQRWAEKLAAAEEKRAVLQDFIDRYADAYAGRSFYRPTAYETGVRVSEQNLRDGPPPALWDNPYDHGPGGRGFTVVGQ